MTKIDIKATRLTAGDWTLVEGAPEERWFDGPGRRKFVSADRIYWKNTGDTAVDFSGLTKSTVDYVGEHYVGFLQFEVRDLANNMLLRLPKPWPVGWTLEPGEERAFFGFFPWCHWDITGESGSSLPNGDYRFVVAVAGGHELNIPTRLINYDVVPIPEPQTELPSPTLITSGFAEIKGLLGEVLKRLPPPPA